MNSKNKPLLFMVSLVRLLNFANFILVSSTVFNMIYQQMNL